MVVVADKLCLCTSPAGALASAGLDLDRVVEGAKCAVEAVKTLGVALDAVTVPGATSHNDRLDGDDVVEIGMGIHGEPGMKQTNMMTSKDFAKIMVDTVRDFGRVDDDNGSDTVLPLFGKKDGLAVLVNNLGGTSNFELTILAGDVVSYLDEDQEKKKSAAQLQTVSMSDFSSKAESYLRAAANALLEPEPLLTECDTIVGDGDCGLTMARGAKEILSRWLDNQSLDTSHPVLLFTSIADAVSASMGGTSGVLLELMFRKIGSHLLASSSAIDETALCGAFHAGVDAVSLYGGATVGSRTMLDALFPAVSAVEEESGSIEKAADAAESGAEGTAFMLSASAGRSNYLRQDSLEGTPDPGAVAVGVVLRAMSKV